MKKKIVSILLCAALGSALLVGCGSSSSSSTSTSTTTSADAEAASDDADSATTIALDGSWPEETVKIGVEVYDTTDLTVIAYMEYFSYLEEYYNVEFMFSESISSAEDELAFVDSCASAGCVGYIGGYCVSMEECVNTVLAYGMYYWGCERSLDEIFADNELYLGGFETAVDNADLEGQNGDYMVGYELAYILAEQGAEHILYCSGGASWGIQMFVDRQVGFIAGIEAAQADGYNVQFDASEDILEGWPGTDDYTAGQSKALSLDYDAIAVSSSGIDVWIQPIAEAGKSDTVKIAGVGGVTDSLLEVAQTGELALLIYECEEIVFGNAVVMMLNAATGNEDIARLSSDEVEAITVSRWYITTAEEYTAIYEKHDAGEYFISAEDMAQLFPVYNEDASYEGLFDFYASFTLDAVVN